MIWIRMTIFVKQAIVIVTEVPQIPLAWELLVEVAIMMAIDLVVRMIHNPLARVVGVRIGGMIKLLTKIWPTSSLTGWNDCSAGNVTFWNTLRPDHC